MRFVLLIKWLLIVVFTAFAWILAMPLFLVFMWSNRRDTQKYLEHMGGELLYDIKEDFAKADKAEGRKDGYGEVWIGLAIVVLLFAMYVGQL